MKAVAAVVEREQQALQAVRGRRPRRQKQLQCARKDGGQAVGAHVVMAEPDLLLEPRRGQRRARRAPGGASGTGGG